MPYPLVVFPWGSKSLTRTLLLAYPSAAERFIAVVDFPTPPFWLIIAKTFVSLLVNPRFTSWKPTNDPQLPSMFTSKLCLLTNVVCDNHRVLFHVKLRESFSNHVCFLLWLVNMLVLRETLLAWSLCFKVMHISLIFNGWAICQTSSITRRFTWNIKNFAPHSILKTYPTTRKWNCESEIRRYRFTWNVQNCLSRLYYDLLNTRSFDCQSYLEWSCFTYNGINAKLKTTVTPRVDP